MVKSLVFDSGPIINLAMNNLLWILRPMKSRFKGEFYITESVKRECIDRPLTSKKFKYEAIETMKVVEEGTLSIFRHRELNVKTVDMLCLANSLFSARGNYIKNIQYAEVESIAAALLAGSSAVVIDEFITRMLIEDPLKVKERMEKKIHEQITIDKKNLSKVNSLITGLKTLRSFEIVTVAYELGIFQEYVLKIKEPKKSLLDALLWAIKLNGCSVSEQEIMQVMKIEGF